MQVTLMGPCELGFWVLTNCDGDTFPFVSRHEEHPIAAALLGWQKPEGIDDEEAVIMNAIDWLMDHTGEDFDAPAHVAESFRQLNEDNEA